MSEINIILRATDEASKMIGNAASNINGSLDSIQRKAADLDRSTGINWRNVATGMAGIATSAFSLYNAYDRVQDAQLALDKAHTMTASKLEILGDKQEVYNAALVKYGANSAQAKEAAENLEIAQMRYDDAVASASEAQEKLTETMIQSGIQAGVTGLTLVDSAGKVVGQFKNLGTAGKAASSSVDGVSKSAEGASRSGGSLTSTLGLLGIASVGVGTSISMTNGRLEEMAQKGVEVTDTQRALTIASEATGTGIGITLAQALMKAIGLLDESSGSVADMAGKMVTAGLKTDEVTEALARFGYSQTFIDQVNDRIAVLSSEGGANMDSLTGRVNATAGAFQNLAYQAGVAQSQAANAATLSATNAVTAQQTYVAGVNKGLGYVPVMGEGGVVDRPTLALIGEAGEREYVIPERKMGRALGGMHVTQSIYPFVHIGRVSREVDLARLRKAVSEEVANAMANAMRREVF